MTYKNWSKNSRIWLHVRKIHPNLQDITIFYFCMVKMAHALLPNLIRKPVTSNMSPTDFTPTTALSEVLNSDPVKRLFSRPNIVIKTIPLNVHANSTSNNNIAVNNLYKFDSDLNISKRTELTIVPLPSDQEENLLPSKREGKSEIALVPIKMERKPCGHYEPCEEIVCDVAVQQYVDRDGVSPMLAINIEEDEISAPVSKHCANEKCDALSIDHDRCRRAVIRLNRCNRSTACDICGIELQTRRCRIHHKNCTRKNEYRHNETNSAQILKERMREREMQLIEASKAKKNDYMDLTTVMETLKNNAELIIIPKSVAVQQPMVNITVSSTQTTQQVNNMYNVFGKLLPSIPVVLPQQSIFVGKTPCSNENSITTSANLTSSNSRPLTTSTNTVPLPQSQFVTFATHHDAQPITLNDLLFSQSPIVTNSPIQPKPLVTPIRVVPITNLITEPSLLHQTQGIPKFCIIADPPVPVPAPAPAPVTVPSPIPVTKRRTTRHSTSVPKVNTPKALKGTLQKKKKTAIRKKRRHKKKEFKCEYCLKCFSTDWYFKVHVAKHTGEKRFPCKICTESFSNRYDMKRHMSKEHENDSIPSGPCNQQTTLQCLDCNISYTSVVLLERHRQKCHKKTECTICHDEILIEELERHIASVHNKIESIDIKEEIVENGNAYDEISETKVFSKKEIKKEHDQNMNGYVSISDQLSASDIKKESEYQV
ncbi:uncharacterized protein LOC128875381 [Hylaeus volcanicus]|uniref:uncharacterized protein LOC128875381 n=1 Tax=Hylaeus volcanicus TaxID=313075 RepID=UPI0023B810FD|nr:uncharacterized protein LOC128875381 [Hylaeus volcanicus]